MDPVMTNASGETDGMNKTLSFMDELDKEDSFQKELQKMKNTPEAKLRMVSAEKDFGKDDCMKYILGRVYNDSIPVDEVISPKDLDDTVTKFARKRLEKMGKPCDKNECLFYVKEAIKRNPNSPFANVYESVSRFIDEMYLEAELNINDAKPEDLGFKRTPDIENSMDDVIRNNNLDGLAEAIKDNVKNSVSAEVDAAKKEKEDRMDLENSMASDSSLNSEQSVSAAIESAMAFTEKSVYQPSLFEGIMIGKFNEMNNIPHGIYESSVDDMFTEGVLSAIKDYFKIKKAASVKATIIKSSDTFNRWLDNKYRTQYAKFKTSVLPIDFKSLYKMYNEAISNKEFINENATVKVIDVNKGKQKFDDLKKLNSDNLGNYKIDAAPFPESYPAVTVKFIDYPKEVDKALKILHGEFDNPKLKKFIDTYGKMAVDKSKDAQKDRDVEYTFNKVCAMVLCDVNIYNMCAYVVLSFVQHAKNVIDFVSRRAMKESAYEEAVKEYTMYNVAKALCLEKFDYNEVRDIASEYASN